MVIQTDTKVACFPLCDVRTEYEPTFRKFTIWSKGQRDEGVTVEPVGQSAALKLNDEIEEKISSFLFRGPPRT